MVYICPKCKNEYHNRHDLQIHQKKQLCKKSSVGAKIVEIYECTECGKKFDRKYNHDRHMVNIHKVSSNVNSTDTLSLEQMFEDTKRMMVECIKICGE